MNTEAVNRLEKSFNSENESAAVYGGAELSALFRMLGAAANFIEARTGESCTADYLTNVAVKAAWVRLIDNTRPRIPEEILKQAPADRQDPSQAVREFQDEINAFQKYGENAVEKLFPVHGGPGLLSRALANKLRLKRTEK